MTLNTFAHRALRAHVMHIWITQAAVDNDPRVQAWLVWSMRGTPAAREDHKTFNHARRVLQRSGRTSI